MKAESDALSDETPLYIQLQETLFWLDKQRDSSINIYLDDVYATDIEG